MIYECSSCKHRCRILSDNEKFIFVVNYDVECPNGEVEFRKVISNGPR